MQVIDKSIKAFLRICGVRHVTSNATGAKTGRKK